MIEYFFILCYLKFSIKFVFKKSFFTISFSNIVESFSNFLFSGFYFRKKQLSKNMYFVQEQPVGCCYVVHFISALCLLDVVTAFGCLAMYLKNTAFHLVQGFHIMIAFGLFGFSFDHTKKGIWQCICFLVSLF